MSGARVEIARLSALCLAPDVDAAGSRFRDEVDRLAAELAPALARMLAPLDEQDGVCLIRRLEVDLALDLDRPFEGLRDAWASALAGSIARALGGGDGVVRYPDRAAQLAAFVADLADGDAWSFWRNAPYDGLRALPSAMAIRTALLRDPDLGLAALSALDPRRRERAIRALGEVQAALVLDGIADRDASRAPDIDALSAALAGAGDPLDAPERAALALATAAFAAHRRPTAEEVALARTAARLRSDARRQASPQSARATGARAAIAAAAPGIGAAAARRLADAVALSRADPAIGDTPYGGLFLLLEALDDVPFDVAGLTGPDGIGAEPLLRFLVLANALGADAGRVFDDPIWRALFALPPRLARVDVEDWARAVPRGAVLRLAHPIPGSKGAAAGLWPDLPPAFARFVGRARDATMARFARRLPGFAGSSHDYLRRNFLDVSAAVAFADDAVTVRLGRAPLDVILAMSAAADATLTIDWLTRRTVRIRREV